MATAKITEQQQRVLDYIIRRGGVVSRDDMNVLMLRGGAGKSLRALAKAGIIKWDENRWRVVAAP